ncbi:MAG: hypothetical protein F4Z01_07550 [Gammaproteobacteria bacterium]|nr:hypothetical protein [Gammaproteobacteria bacterium]MYF39210.1 hypothetical protein [Gammaproteobacteria bacterium]
MRYFGSLKVLTATVALLISGQLVADVEIKQYAEGEIDVNRLKSQVREPDFAMYVSGGGSFFSQNTGSMIGEGAAFRFALGIQHNKWFGTELFSAKAPSLETKTVAADLSESTDQYISRFNIETQPNKYLGILGRLSIDVSERFSLIGKFGVARYTAHRVDADVTLDGEDDISLSPYGNQDGGVKGYSPVVSLGFEMPFPDVKSEHGSAELMLTRMYDDKVESWSLNLSLKYTH